VPTLRKIVCPECHKDEYTYVRYIHVDCPEPLNGDFFEWAETALTPDEPLDPNGKPATRPCPGCGVDGGDPQVYATHLLCCSPECREQAEHGIFKEVREYSQSQDGF
jgi:hypothetical protein